MNSRNETEAIRDVSCTNGLLYDSELRGAGPNPLDFRSVMEEIREKTGSFFFFFSLPCACYSPLVFGGLIVMSGRMIYFNAKKKKLSVPSWKPHEPPETYDSKKHQLENIPLL